MNAKLRILLRVINNRILGGELLDDVIASYQKLTTDEIAIIKGEVEK